MSYTPKQIGAFLAIAAQRRRRELAERLHIAALGAQGDGKAVKETLKELSDDA